MGAALFLSAGTMVSCLGHKDIRFYSVSGSSFADEIIKNKVTGESVIVSTFGISPKQAERLVNEFDDVVINVDASQSTLNPDAFAKLISLNKKKTCKIVGSYNHAKTALIDGEKLIVTSANLTENRKIECYLVADSGVNIKGVSEYFEKVLALEKETLLHDMKTHRENAIKQNAKKSDEDDIFSFDIDFEF